MASSSASSARTALRASHRHGINFTSAARPQASYVIATSSRCSISNVASGSKPSPGSEERPHPERADMRTARAAPGHQRHRQVSSSSTRPAVASPEADSWFPGFSRQMERRDQRSRETPDFNMRLTPPAAKDIESVQNWLRAAFPSMPFPDDVALQMITHESYDHGLEAGHNRRLAFVGRRALKFFTSLFLAQRAPQNANHAKVDMLVQTSRLGDGPGRALKLAEVMRWTPALNDGQLGPKETGLYKIRGVTVEALVGAVYHQHGAQRARDFFNARVLPHLDTFEPNEVTALQSAIAEEQRQGEEALRA